MLMSLSVNAGVVMERARIGLIGTSGWADWMYMPSLKSHPGGEVVAVSGRNAERLADFATRHGIPRTFTDYRAMLDAGGLDGVIVCVPDDQHKQMTLDILDAGLNVLCEKPLANNVADCEEMLAKARAADRRHMVLYTWRWQPHFQFLKHQLETGLIGRVYRAQFNFHGGWARTPDYQWRGDGHRSNGVLGDLGSHMIDLSRWLIGDVRAVSADASRMIDRSGFGGDPAPVNDTAHLTFEYAVGGQGVIDVSSITDVGDSIVRFVVRIDGENGSVEVDHRLGGHEDGVALRVGRGGELKLLEIPDSYFAGFERKDVLGPYHHHRAGARLFIDSILEDRQPEPSFEDAVAVQRVIDAALRSHAERRWIDVN
jgi:predicted dehydrogenase